jgi:hypothetical protein
MHTGSSVVREIIPTHQKCTELELLLGTKWVSGQLHSPASVAPERESPVLVIEVEGLQIGSRRVKKVKYFAASRDRSPILQPITSY